MMTDRNTLILNRDPEEVAYFNIICSKISTAYSSCSFKGAITLLNSIDFNVLVVDYSLASYLSLKGSLKRPLSIIITGNEEKKVKEILSGWPLSHYVDYHITVSGGQDGKAFLRILKKAVEHSLLKIQAENLKRSLELTNGAIKDTHSEIKKIKNVIKEGIVRELEKRLELRERHIRFKKEKQKIEEILKEIYIANDVISLLDIVYDIKDILHASGISIYILDEDESLGKYLKPLVWNDVFLPHPDISKHIVLIDAEDIASHVARSHQEINITDFSSNIRMFRRYLEHFMTPLRSLLCLPIKHGQEVIGVLEVYNRIYPKDSSQEGFSKEDQQIMRTLSEHIALAITKLNLIQYDALTGLLRPDPFFKNIIHMIESQRKRRDEKESYAMVLGDVDWFKNYNDRNGHEAGNRLLRELAKVLKSSTRDQDLLCRYGGEEFLFFLTGLKNLEEACIFTERIKKSIQDHYFRLQEYQPRNNLTMSFGIAYFKRERIDSLQSITRSDLDKIVHEADMALAEAKGKKSRALGVEGKKDASRDKNRICVYYGEPSGEPVRDEFIRPYEKRYVKERRKFARFHTSTLLLYKKNSAHKVAQTINLSSMGVKISSETKLSPEQTLDLIIVLRNKACQFKGDVVYSEKVREDDFPLYYSGLKFRDLSPEDKTILEDYFSTLDLEEKSSLSH